MQDDNGVSWDPVTIYRVTPIVERLYVIGLLVVSVWAFVKVIELVVRLRRLRKMLPDSKQRENENRFWYVWEGSAELAASLNGLAIWTVLTGSAVTVEIMIELLRSVARQKITLNGIVAAALMEGFMPLLLGLWLAVVFYTLGSWFRSLLGKRRLRWKYGR